MPPVASSTTCAWPVSVTVMFDSVTPASASGERLPNRLGIWLKSICAMFRPHGARRFGDVNTFGVECDPPGYPIDWVRG